MAAPGAADWHQPLARFLHEASGADRVAIERLDLLGGGAIQENWALDVVLGGGVHPGRHELVLRTSAAAGLPVSWDRVQEFRILEAAHRAGVTVPEPLWLEAGGGVLGKPFYLMRRLPGEARGFRLVRDAVVLAKGEALAARLGRELAMLHAVAPPVAGLEFMAVPEGAPALARVEEYRRHLDALDAAEPVLEWALAWLEREAPPAGRIRLLHGDFRTGNYLVEAGELAGILDWEFAAFGEPCEDLGWMLARYWRFGANEREAGGIGSRAALLGGYESASGEPLERGRVPYWEVMATVRWAIIALMQAERHFAGGESSLELALTAHVLPQLEIDLLARVREIEAGA
jgi:aminoglycoside phosphotransferase (APT) family kinase protein